MELINFPRLSYVFFSVTFEEHFKTINATIYIGNFNVIQNVILRRKPISDM